MATPKGYLRVRDTYQTRDHDNVYAVGIAADVPVLWQTQVPTQGCPTPDSPPSEWHTWRPRTSPHRSEESRRPGAQAFADIPPSALWQPVTPV